VSSGRPGEQLHDPAEGLEGTQHVRGQVPGFQADDHLHSRLGVEDTTVVLRPVSVASRKVTSGTSAMARRPSLPPLKIPLCLH
jgi:predicted glycosyltransferase